MANTTDNVAGLGKQQDSISHKQVVFEVGGMACAFCATTIEQSLSQVKGIEFVKVIMNTSEVILRFDEKEIDHDSVKKRIAKLGYYVFDESEKKHSDTTVLKDSRKRALAAAAITAPITVLAFLSSMLGLFDFGIGFKLVEMITSALVLFYFGWPIHVGAFNALKGRILNEHVLYGAAGFAAYGVGLISIFYTSAPDFFNVAALLTTFHLAAGWYGAKVRNDTSKSLRKILDLQPPLARILKEEQKGNKVERTEVTVPINEVKVNDLIIVKGGEKIPIDGIIVSGVSTISEAILTGESEPVYKTKGDTVLAGSTNGDGLLVIQTSRVGSETMLMRVAGNVKQIQESKPFFITIFDKVIEKFVLAVLALASLTAIGWIVFNLVTGANQWLQAIYTPLSVLVIGYPCAIGLSTPPVKLRAISIGADNGVLINDASSLFSITKADTIMLDKTGTITEGKPKVNKIVTLNGCSKQMLLEHAAMIEAGSSHPIAKAIIEEAEANNVKPNKTAVNIKQFAGKGMKGFIDQNTIIVGNREFLEEQQVDVASQMTKEESQNMQSVDSPVFVSFDGKLEGVLGMSDTIRPGVVSSIKNLAHAGFDMIMLTGDTKKAAEKVASKLGNIHFQAKMSPMQKADYIKKLQTEYKKTVIAVGDGVNDAPVIAQADVGMAVSSGIDISKETAAFVLLTDDIGVIPMLLNLGKRFTAAVKRNIFLALSFNAIGIPIAAMGYLNPFTAMVIMIADVLAVFASTWFFRPIRTKTKPSSSSLLLSKENYNNDNKTKDKSKPLINNDSFVAIKEKD